MEEITRLTGKRETEVWLGAVATDRETKTERGKERKRDTVAESIDQLDL